MKHIFSILTIAGLICTGFLGCNAGGRTSSATANISKDASYALGMYMGTNFKTDDLIPDMDEFTKGMKDVLNDSETRFSMEGASVLIQQAFGQIMEQREAEYRQPENEFLAENSKKPGINITSSGLQYEVITEETGTKPDAGDTVLVHYEGTLIDGTVFDSSYYLEEPVDIPLSRVIPGWAEGLQLMSVGSKYRFFIPSDLGYGAEGAGQIPPYSTLVFEVELFDIINEEEGGES